MARFLFADSRIIFRYYHFQAFITGQERIPRVALDNTSLPLTLTLTESGMVCSVRVQE